ncbi:hypothetical protein B0H21DRAFT_424243 [Amylocystis lapponica]|nr:hypothetical protein B0H21DRAFT_424243 [Amylocystis lapponica]
MDESQPAAQPAVITFHAPGKSFVRVFRDQSFDELKDIVRRKAGLPTGTVVRLAQFQRGTWIDIEDDDDYEAFCALAHCNTSLEVSVAVGEAPHPFPELATESISNSGSTQNGKGKKRLYRDLSSLRTDLPPAHNGHSARLWRQDISAPSQGPSHSGTRSLEEISRLSIDSDRDGERPKKKRKRHRAAAVHEDSLLSEVSYGGPPQHGKRPSTTSSPAFAVPPSPDVPKLKNKKSKNSALVEPSPEVHVLSALVQKNPRRHSKDVPPISGSPRKGDDESREKKRKRKSVSDAVFSGDEPTGSGSPIRSVSKSTAAPSPPRKKAKQRSVVDVPASDHESIARDMQVDVDGADDESQRKSHKKSKKSRTVEPDDGDGSLASLVQVESTDLLPPKKKKSKQKQGDETVDERQLSHSLASSVQSAEGSEVRKKENKSAETTTTAVAESRAEHAQEEVSSPPVIQAEVEKAKGNSKKKRTQTAGPEDNCPLAGPSSRPALESSVEPGINGDQPSAPKKAKSSRKRTNAASKETSSESRSPAMSSADMMAAVREAAEVVWAQNAAARAKATQAPASASPVEPEAGPSSKPHRKTKEKPGKSKLSTSWKPEDLATQETAVLPASAHPVPEVASPPAIPITKDVSTKTKLQTGKKSSRSSAVFCPVCVQATFHLRYLCPVVVAGADSIRRRIAELKEEQDSVQLLEELEVLLAKAEKKSATQARKTGAEPAVESVLPVVTEHVSAKEDETPSKTKDTAQLSTPSSPALIPSPSSRRTSLAARFPAGSEIAEVAVESKDEGSSESSESDEESVHPAVTPDASVTDIALDTLLQRPHKLGPQRSVLSLIPSESSSDSEESDEDEDEDELEMEDDDDREFRRMTKKYARDGSSSDGDVLPDEATEDGDIVNPTFMDVDPQDAVLHQGDDGQDNASEPSDARSEGPKASIDDGALADADDAGDADNLVEGGEVDETSSAEVGGNIDDNGDRPQEVDDSAEGAKVSTEDTITQPPPTIDGTNDDEASSSQSTKDRKTDSPKEADSPAPSPDITSADPEQPNIAADTRELTDAPTSPVVEDTTSAETTSGGFTTTEFGGTTSSIIPVSSINAPDEAIQTSFSEDRPGSDGLADPIEPADDLLDPKPPPVQGELDEDDPIEVDTQTTPERQQNGLYPLRSPGIVQRMRDRFGRLADQKDLPVLASALFDGVSAQSTPAPLRKGRASSLGPAPPAVAQSEAGDTSVAQRTRMSTRRSMSGAAMPPPPAPAADVAAPSTSAPVASATSAPAASSTSASAALGPSAPAPKPRGRPRLTQEEKDRRAAEKAKVAAERAEKRRIEKAEKEEQKRREKEAKARGKKPTKGGKAPPPSNPATIVQNVPSTPPAPAPGPPPSSQVKWTTLAQEPSFVEPETSMCDELQSSSPTHSLPRASSPVAAQAERAKAPVEYSAAETPTQQRSLIKTGRMSQLDGSDPLFLPDSSQYPETPLVAAAALAIGARRHEPDDSSDSDKDVEGGQGEEGEEEEEDAPKTQERAHNWTSMAPFHRLSDIASQTLFTPPAFSRNSSYALRPVDQSQSRTSGGMGNVTGDDDEDGDEDDSGDDDDSDDSEDGDGTRSHIPKERRAGAGVQKKRASGLLGYAFGR